MTNIFELLDKIIRNENPDLKITIDSSLPNNNIIHIKEIAIDAKLKKMSLTNFTGKKVFAFKIDDRNIDRICNIFDKHVAFFNKGCDAIIFAEIDKKNYIFICELKSDKPSPLDYENQFKSSNAFIDYLTSLLNYFHNIDLKTFERKNILFMSGERVSKQATGTKSKEQIYIKKEFKCATPDDKKDIRKCLT